MDEENCYTSYHTLKICTLLRSSSPIRPTVDQEVCSFSSTYVREISQTAETVPLWKCISKVRCLPTFWITLPKQVLSAKKTVAPGSAMYRRYKLHGSCAVCATFWCQWLCPGCIVLHGCCINRSEGEALIGVIDNRPHWYETMNLILGTHMYIMQKSNHCINIEY